MTDATHSAMREAVVQGRVDAARELAEAAIRDGLDLLAAVEHGFSAGIREVGDLWEEGEYFLPELVQGAEAMKAAMAVLQPVLAEDREAMQALGTVVIGTVEGDVHDIGKTLVATLLEAHGFAVHDLGADVPVDRFVEVAAAVEADIVAASALLTTTMTTQATLVAALRDAGLPARVMVGGAPTTPAWAERIGAVHADNAQRAVAVARELLR